MKLNTFDTTGKSLSQVELPIQFQEPLRKDLIKKAVLTIQNNNRQAYGAFDNAGLRCSADLSRRRRKYRGSYGHGISRVPRKILSRRGTQMFWVGAEIPGTVGGRRAHPPKPIKEWGWKLNTKEKRKAICSAISATVIKETVKERGHKIPDNYPFIIDGAFENLTKTKEVVDALLKLGFKEELERAGVSGIRAGKGKIRGRKRVTKKSLLFVVLNAVKLSKAAKNIPGIDVVNIKKLNAEMLAPGGHPGRATLFTNNAVEVLKQGFFTKDYKEEIQESHTSKSLKSLKNSEKSNGILKTKEKKSVKKSEPNEIKKPKESKEVKK